MEKKGNYIIKSRTISHVAEWSIFRLYTANKWLESL